MSSHLAKQGYIVVVMEHEGGAASYCCSEESNTIHEYVVPPIMTKDQQSKGYDAFLELCRDFRRPMLEKREKEIERVVQCLRGETKDGMYLNSLRISNQISEYRDSKYIDKSSDFNLSG